MEKKMEHELVAGIPLGLRALGTTGLASFGGLGCCVGQFTTVSSVWQGFECKILKLWRLAS